MKKYLVLGLCLGLLASQAGAQTELRANVCSRLGKPALYETNEYSDLGWFPSDCDIARLEKNTPTRDAEDNTVTGTRICRYQEPHTPENLCYEFSHGGGTGDTAIILRKKVQFDSSIGMVQRTPQFDVCLVNWHWVSPTDNGYIPITPRPTGCGVHDITEGDVCLEISSSPAPAGYVYCATKCALLQRGLDQQVTIDNGPPPPPPPPPQLQGQVSCSALVDNGEVRSSLCTAYLYWFGRSRMDASGARFYENLLFSRGISTSDPYFIRRFQDGCGEADCNWMCANHSGVPYCDTLVVDPG